MAQKHRPGALLVPKVRKNLKWLMPGVVLMKKFMSLRDQQAIVDLTFELGKKLCAIVLRLSSIAADGLSILIIDAPQ